jgi:hypothetical protein
MVSDILPLFAYRSDASLFFYARFTPLGLCPGTVHPTMDIAELTSPNSDVYIPTPFWHRKAIKPLRQVLIHATDIILEYNCNKMPAICQNVRNWEADASNLPGLEDKQDGSLMTLVKQHDKDFQDSQG